MQFSLHIDQKRAIDWDLDVSECVMLDLIIRAAGWSNTLIFGEEVYYWLAHSKIKEEIPLIATSEQTTRRILARLTERGLVEIHQFEHKTGYRLTEKGKEWDTTEKHSPDKPNAKMAEPNAKMVGYNVTIDNTNTKSQGVPRPPKRVDAFENKEDIPGWAELPPAMTLILGSLYELGWKLPKSRDLQVMRDDLRDHLRLAGLLIKNGQGYEQLAELETKTEVRRFVTYWQGQQDIGKGKKDYWATFLNRCEKIHEYRTKKSR